MSRRSEMVEAAMIGGEFLSGMPEGVRRRFDAERAARGAETHLARMLGRKLTIGEKTDIRISLGIAEAMGIGGGAGKA